MDPDESVTYFKIFFCMFSEKHKKLGESAGWEGCL